MNLFFFYVCKNLVMFSPIFVMDTKIIYGYNFAAPLIRFFGSVFVGFILNNTQQWLLLGPYKRPSLEINKKALRLFQLLIYYISLNFPTLLIKTPPLFLRNLRS